MRYCVDFADSARAQLIESAELKRRIDGECLEGEQ